MECTWDAALLAHGAELPSELLQVIQSGSDAQYLNAITRASLDPRYTYILLAHCEDMLAHVCATLRSHASLPSAIATLGRVVPFAPFLIPYAERLLAEEYTFGVSTDPSEDQSYLLGLFRLFSFEPRNLEKFIRPQQIAPLLEHPSRPVVYLAIRILQIYYHGADHWFEQMVQRNLGEDSPESSINGTWDDKVIDYRFLTLWEEDRFKRVLRLIDEANCAPHTVNTAHVRVLDSRCFDESTALVGGILLPRTIDGSDPTRTTVVDLIQTPTISSNLRAIASALKGPKPVLIKGLAGAGKTLLIRHVAQSLGKLEQMVTLHLTQQSDVKLLMGVYTTGPTPGSFVWKPGVLTTAVREGRWVLIEDLDRAPNEIIGSLLPLIEKGELMIPNRKEVIQAASGFRIIATVRTSLSHRGQSNDPVAEMLGIRHWQQLSIEMPQSDELQQITGQLYPSLSRLLPQIHKLHERLHASWHMIATSRQVRSGILRRLSPTDLLKWCERVCNLLRNKTTLTSNDMDNIFLEGMDCFAGSLPSTQLRSAVADLAAEELRIDPRRRDYLLDQREVQYAASESQLNVGRYSLARSLKSTKYGNSATSFSTNPHTNRMLEKVAGVVINCEPLLLVGETGVGKTAAVQHLATHMGKKLVPFNLSQQSEAGDLLGGFKPVNARSLFVPVKDEFDELFGESFSFSKNQQFLDQLGKQTSRGNWKAVCKLWQQALKMVDRQRADSDSRIGEGPSKKRKVESKKIIDFAKWDAFAIKVTDMERRLASSNDTFAFSFVEGNIVKALRNGDWILLDEINLASSDTLESIADLLDPTGPSILLTESGSIERVVAHPDFRVFAAMNPATDVGKKDLPPGIRSRFTELYVESPDNDIKSLTSIVQSYLRHESANDQAIATDVSKLYQSILQLAARNELVDGAGAKPHFSLRTLTRTLSYAKYIAPFCSLRRALYEGFQMSFLTLLDTQSVRLVQPFIEQNLFGKRTNLRAELQKPLRKPSDRHVQGYPGSKHWVQPGLFDVEEQPHYILTPFIRNNLENLIRASSTRQFPVLIQGPTSSGKTSMIEYLAKRTGHKFVRINNHEHTDLQEYLGTYVSGADGRLQFQDGVLVKALREGHWLVLDELNLAPSDVLEALNRLLDDNRELLVPETQEVIRPHQHFMLFATQNPAGLYGGRKTLSRAFRNRFLELHFDDIPIEELQEILHRRTQLPESRCKRIVSVYRELSVLRQENRLFEQKSFATLRDLFRWAQRPNDTIEQLAANGFMLLAERVRKPEERQLLKATFERVISEKVVTSQGQRVSINETQLYSQDCPEIAQFGRNLRDQDVVWTKAMRRLYVLVARALANNEPVLLVGETGCGKTTVCQMLADALGKTLHSVNAHQNTEAGDLIGSQRPLRNRAVIEANLRHQLLLSALLQNLDNASAMSTDGLLDNYDRMVSLLPKEERGAYLRSSEHLSIQHDRTRFKALFEWVDGSLVQAMKEGSLFLLDEISLADDSVLERLNSVLESDRSILLAEKGSIDSSVTAILGFQFLATMNPGGDYGKRELSPALRNRFTEIWVPPLSDTEDIIQIMHAKLMPDASNFVEAMVAFAQWFKDRYNTSASSSISIRDALSWASCVNVCSADIGVDSAIINGAAMVYIDTLGANPAGLMATSTLSIQQERNVCIDQLSKFLARDSRSILSRDPQLKLTSDTFNIEGFSLHRRANASHEAEFSFEPVTTRVNALRVVRALRLPKPVMLEGNPGVGKTALVTAIAEAISVPLTRINLSEQTDLIDLFGSDVPLEGAETGNFAWQDALFLRAMKKGEWVLLDEMNLASQSILEGLNACLDHRGEVFVPELGQTFSRHPDFKLFAAQNPHHQGGGRKGLPASFINRFTVVYADAFRPDDLKLLAQRNFPAVDSSIIDNVIGFVHELDHQTSQNKHFSAKGAPGEFNYRDVARFLALVTADQPLLKAGSSRDFVDLVFSQRFRSATDRAFVQNIFHHHFGSDPVISDLFSTSSSTHLQLGLGLLQKSSVLATPRAFKPGHLEIGHNRRTLQSIMLCVQHNWPVILAGRSGVGKTALLERLAGTIGVEVVTLAINSETDAMDLIGGFEQTDSHWHAKQSKPFWVKDTDVKALTVLRSGTAYMNHSTQTQTDSQHEDHEDTNTTTEPTFEWIDGILVDAIREGKWFILDNANLCSASVLDRLNSLLEPNGVLIVNERNNTDGSPQIIRPHPDFRIFLTVIPRFGELSRAMRNRAVELYLSAPETGEAIATTALNPFFTEAILFRLRSFQVLGTTASNFSPTDHMVRTMMDHLSPADQPLLNRFIRQSSAGLYGLSAATIQDLEKTLRSPLRVQARAAESSLKLYEAALSQTQVPADFTRVQTFHPLSNQALVQISQQSTALAPCFAFVHDCGVHLISIYELLQKARSNATIATAMLRLERSMGLSIGASSSYPNGSAILGLLDSTLQQLGRCLESVLANRAGEDFNIIKSPLNKLAAVGTLLLENLFRGHLDAARLNTLLAMGRRFAARRTRISPDTAQPLEIIEQSLETTLSTIGYDSNHASAALWKALRPSTPTTQEHFDAVLRLDSVIENFDNLCRLFVLPLEKAVDLRVSFARTIDLASNGSNTVAELATKLEELMSGAAADVKDIASPPTPHFQQVFLQLSEHFNLFSLCGHQIPAKERATIDIFAQLPTKMGSAFASNANKLLCLERSVASIANGNNGNTEDHVEAPVSRSLVEHLSNTGQVPLSQVDLLEAEVGSLGQVVGAHAHLLEEGPCDSLDACLRDLVGVVLGALVAQEDDESLRQVARALKDQLDSRAALTPGSIRQASRASPVVSVEPSNILLQELKAAIIYLQADFREAHVRLNQAANAWACFSITCLHLYVPRRAFDPALESTYKQMIFDWQKTDLTGRLQALRDLRRLLTGTADSFRATSLEQDILALGPVPEVEHVYRPQHSQLSELQLDFDALLRILQPLHAAAPHTVLDLPIDSTIVSNLTKIRHRLSSQYCAYEDFVAPVVGFIDCLLIAQRLALAARAKIQRATSDTGLARVIPFVGASLDSWGSDQALIDVTSGLRDRKEVISWLSVVAMRSAVSLASKPDAALLGTISQRFDQLHQQWQSELSEERQASLEKSSLYKYRYQDTETDEGIQEELEGLFSPGSVDHVEASQKKTTIRAQDDVSTIAQLHQGIFVPKEAQDGSFGELLLQLSSLATDSRRGVDDRELTPTLVLLLQNACLEISAAGSNERAYNMYTDANIGQMRKLLSLIHGLIQRFEYLQRSWPEHATPVEVLRQCKDILQVPRISPLPSLLPRLEKLFATINDWQSIASREFTVHDLLTQTSDLIISWRQLELSTWAGLFDREWQQCQDTAASWWYVAYETLIATTSNIEQASSEHKKHVKDILDVLEGFIQSSGLGEYSSRLQILRSFEAHLSLTAEKASLQENIRTALANFNSFYGHFEDSVAIQVSEGRKKLEKEIKNVIQLASWKDRNIDVLRQSAVSSHRKLLRLVRKFRNLLAQPVQAIITEGFRGQVDETILDTLTPYPSTQSEDGIPTLDIELSIWQGRPDRYRNPYQTGQTLHAKLQGLSEALDAPSKLKTFVDDLNHQILELQKSTPSTSTDENKTFIHHLKTRKRRLLADVLKGVRRMGYQTAVSDQVSGQQNSLSAVLARMTAPSNDQQLPALRSAQHELHRLVSVMPTVRASARKHSEDLTSAEILRCSSLLESMLSVSVASYNHLLTSLEQYQELSETLDQLTAVAVSRSCHVTRIKGSAGAIDGLTAQLYLQRAIQTAVRLLRAQASLSSTSYADITDKLQEKAEKLQDLINQGKSLRKLPPAIENEDGAMFKSQCRAFNHDLQSEIEVWSSSYPETQPVLSQLQKWTTRTSVSDQEYLNDHVTCHPNEWVQELLSTCDTTLASVQAVEKALEHYRLSANRSWVADQLALLRETFRALGMLQLGAQMRRLLSLLRYAESGSTDLNNIAAVLHNLQPIFESYRRSIAELVQLYCNLCARASNMGYALATSYITIAQRGFCKPSEKSKDESGKSGDMEAGTGLGDGEGAEDISKDIGDDEDLSELAQEGKRENDTSEVEQEKDAVDMADEELEGEVDGMESTEDIDEDADKEGREDDQDVDEEAGDASLDSDAIDEKMWDGQTEGTEPDKQADSGRGASKNEEVTAADDGGSEAGDGQAQDEAEVVTGNEEDIKNQEEKVDSHVEDGSNLDLPDDMDKDEDKIDEGDISDLVSISDGEADVQDATNDQAEETSPGPDGPDVDHVSESGQDEQEQTMQGVEDERGDNEDEDMQLSPQLHVQDNDNLNEEGEGMIFGDDNNDTAAGTEHTGLFYQEQERAQDDEDVANDGDEQSEAGPGVGRDQETGTSQGKDSSKDDTERLPFKQLGDVLEQWYNRHRKISDARQQKGDAQAQEDHTSMEGVEFEHVPDEDAAADAQAIGGASAEQSVALNEDNAIQDDENVSTRPDDGDKLDERQLEPQSHYGPEDRMQIDSSDAVVDVNPPTSFVGGDKQLDGQQPFEDDPKEEPQLDDMDDVDEQLTRAHISNEDTVTELSFGDAQTLWAKHEDSTRNLALILTEHLRLILQPTQATKMRGDFRTGKRLNIKRIIPYIASSYKRDKIWMRRSTPTKRSYQIMLAIDDSKSMAESGSQDLAFETLALIAKSMAMLEVGELSIVGFGEDVKVAHDFATPFTSDTGSRVLQQFSFAQNSTNVKRLLQQSIALFRSARLRTSGSASDLWQLQLIISDGICDDHPSIRQLVREAIEERIMIVFVVIDFATQKGAGGEVAKQSILDTQRAEFAKDEGGNMQVKMVKYLDTFPFQYYLIVQNIQELPNVLAGALRQWFAEVVETSS